MKVFEKSESCTILKAIFQMAYFAGAEFETIVISLILAEDGGSHTTKLSWKKEKIEHLRFPKKKKRIKMLKF